MEAGFRAVIVSIDPKQIGSEFCGREFDATFLRDVPAEVDPCGEQGEFHTFVYSGPIFARPLDLRRGPVVERDGFYFCDLQLSD
jgi:diphthamide synthase (EF-2-diphthine--ammonia ligase)